MDTFYEILTTKRTKRIRDPFEYALCKFVLYLLTYLLVKMYVVTLPQYPVLAVLLP